MQRRENVIYNEEKKNQSIENNPEMTQMIELVDKDIKTVINIFHMFEKLREKLNILRKDMKYVRNTQTEILEVTAIAFR